MDMRTDHLSSAHLELSDAGYERKLQGPRACLRRAAAASTQAGAPGDAGGGGA